MKTTDFAEHLASFLTMYLPGQGLCENTIISYRDTFKLILEFAESKRGLRPERIQIENFTGNFVGDFLCWLELDKNCSVATRNQRLGAIHSFAKYVSKKNPAFIFERQKISDIGFKKHPKGSLQHITSDCMQKILCMPDKKERYGRRDVVLLTLLYDSAARVQELCDLQIRNIRLQKPYTVTLIGKGQKTRTVPIMNNTAVLLQKYIADNNLNRPGREEYPLFFNHQGMKLTRAGVTYILKKYVTMAQRDDPGIPSKISPHVLRHSKAMHMLQHGINLVYIRDFLGHSFIETTEVYAKADTETKRREIEKAQITVNPSLPDWCADKPLMDLLTNLNHGG